MSRYAEILSIVLKGAGKSFVMFENGTAVIFTDAAPDADLRGRAEAILREHGPVHAGGPAGDFQVVVLPDERGWVVGGHHPDVLTVVAPDEVTADAADVSIGLLGRKKRDQDARGLVITDVADARGKR